MMQNIKIPERNKSNPEAEKYSDPDIEDEEEANMETSSYAIVKMKNHMSLQLVIVQVLQTLCQFNSMLIDLYITSSFVNFVQYSALIAHPNKIGIRTNKIQQEFCLHVLCSTCQ